MHEGKGGQCMAERGEGWLNAQVHPWVTSLHKHTWDCNKTVQCLQSFRLKTWAFQSLRNRRWTQRAVRFQGSEEEEGERKKEVKNELIYCLWAVFVHHVIMSLIQFLHGKSIYKKNECVCKAYALAKTVGVGRSKQTKKRLGWWTSSGSRSSSSSRASGISWRYSSLCLSCVSKPTAHQTQAYAVGSQT